MNISDLISKGKDIKDLSDIGEGLVGIIGVAKTVSEVFEGRSLELERDKLLVRIQGLVAVRLEFGTDENIKSQIDEAKGKFIAISQKLTEHAIKAAGLTVPQRAFLLYKPPNALAWIPHILYWLNVLIFPYFVSKQWDENRFDAIPGILFYVGLLLLIRQWGLVERKRHIQGQNPSKWLDWFWHLTAVLYGLIALAFLVRFFGRVRSKETVDALIGGAGFVIMYGCSKTLWEWAELCAPSETPTDSIRRPFLLLLSPAALTIASVLVLAPDARYLTHQWSDNPSSMLFLLVFIALPWHAGLSYVYSKRMPTLPPADTAERGTSVTQA
jgi:hypothetical protein